MHFLDRRQAGQVLADRLRTHASRHDVVVLALPRGGVPVAAEVSALLQAPLDVFVVRKLGVPGHEELAMGALATGGVRVLNDDVIAHLSIPPAAIDQVTAREQRELERRERLYRGDRPPLDVRDRVAILIDDGLATGSTMRAAVRAVRPRGPAEVLVAVPVGSAEACADLGREADLVICAHIPRWFSAVGEWYGDFSQTSDEEVHDILETARRSRPS